MAQQERWARCRRSSGQGVVPLQEFTMTVEQQIKAEAPAALAQRLAEVLQRERIVPRFVDSYVVEHGRHALQVHASLYRDRLELLQREALLAVTARALEITYAEPL